VRRQQRLQAQPGAARARRGGRAGRRQRGSREQQPRAGRGGARRRGRRGPCPTAPPAPRQRRPACGARTRARSPAQARTETAAWVAAVHPAPQSASLHAQQSRHTCRRNRPPGCAARRASLRCRQAPRGCCSARGHAQASTTAARLLPGARGRRSVAGCGARYALHHANCCHAHAVPHRCRLLPAILQRLNVFADDHHLGEHRPSPCEG